MTVKKSKDTLVQISNAEVSLLTVLSYLFDWIAYGILIVFSIWFRAGHPRYHEFSLEDNSISHTYYNDVAVLFSDLMLFTMSLGFPVLLSIFVHGFNNIHSTLRKLWNIHSSLLSFVSMHAFQSAIVSILKMELGIARPDMISRCLPRNFGLAPLGSLSNVAICGNPDVALIRSGFKSFPSGHAATAFTSALFCFFLFSTKYRIFDQRSISPKIVLSVVPIKLALLIAASRYSDNRHFVSDLIAGSMVGLGSSYVGYRMYFHSVLDPMNAGMAIPPRRVWSDDPTKLFWRITDDPGYIYDKHACVLSEELDRKGGQLSSVLNSASIAGELSRGRLEQQRTQSRATSRLGSRRFEN